MAAGVLYPTWHKPVSSTNRWRAAVTAWHVPGHAGDLLSKHIDNSRVVNGDRSRSAAARW